MGYGRNTENLYYKDKLGQHWHSRQKPAYPQTQYLCPVNAQKNFFRATYPGHFQQIGYPGLISRPMPPTPRYTQCLYEISPSYHFDGSVASIQNSFSPPNPGFYSPMPENFILGPAQTEVQYMPFYPSPPLGSQIPTSQIAWDNPVPAVNYIPLPLHGKSVEEMSFVSCGLADQISSHVTGRLPVKQQDSNMMTLTQYSQDTANSSWQAPSNFGPSLFGPLAGQDHTTQYGYRTIPVPTSEALESSGHQSDTVSVGHQNDTVSVISQLAREFVESCCPYLGERPYCIPPVQRTRHPDKSSKLLVLSMESEKRVLGSFERYFGEHKMPVFMLCHYPTSGFMKAFNNQFGDRKDAQGSANSVTLMLLSSLFDVTLVTVSIISGNSDFAYIQRAVLKSAAHMKRCKTAVNNWLTYLGIRLKVREVLAFPNLKKAMLQRIAKDKSFKHMHGNLVTLHVDDLSAPFEEEWSTPVHKHQFTEWMKSKVLCHTTSVLTRDQLLLFVGALLSPRLSTVEYMKDMISMEPISDSALQNDTTKDISEDLSKLKLTIDGVTKTFDEFMDEYVLSYYPEVDSKSYRVPPIHFNIQSLKKPAEYLKDTRLWYTETDLKTGICQPDKEFMPRHTSYKYNVKRSTSEDSGWKCDGTKILGQTSCPKVHGKNGTNEYDQSPVLSSGGDEKNFRFNSVKAVANYSVTRESQVPLNEILKGVEVITDVMKKDTRADEGENRVISSLEYIASDQRHKPMFIICGYQYNNYLNKLREEMFSKGEANRPVRAFGQTMRAEHDCLIFHKKYGAIIVCIKAIGDNFSDWNASLAERMESTNKILKKAVKQLEREEAMIHHVTSDLCPGLKCHRLIALPNMKREDVKDALEKDSELKKNISQLTNGRGVDMFLCQDELSTKFTSIWDQPKAVKFRLMSWWNDVVDNLLTDTKDKDSTEKNVQKEMSAKVYRQIIGRYCGLLSTVEVWSPNNPRVEVRSASEAANVCAKRFAKLVLLPHQVEVLCSDYHRLFLYGPPGSGKTLLLILKAREWLLANRTVIILNARPGSAYGYPYAYGVVEKLKKMLEPHKSLEKNLYLCNIDSLQFKPEALSQVLPTTCVIMDEVTPSSHPIIEHLCCLQVQYIWCAGGFLEDRPITARGFHTCQMDKILRCPPIVQTLLKHTEKDVRLFKPYQQIYQSTPFQLPKSPSKKTDRENKTSFTNSFNQPSELNKFSHENKFQGNNSRVKFGEKETVELVEKLNVDVVSYDADSLNKRLLAKYSNKSKQQSNLPGLLEKTSPGDTEEHNLSWYTTSSVEFGLATDGPRPHIIDHQGHSNEPKYPQDCHQCAEELARFLQSLVRESGFLASLDQRNQPSKNKYAFKVTSSSNKSKMSKPGELTIYSNVSSIYTKPSPAKPTPDFNSKALLWTDVLMVVRDINPDCTFLTMLSRRGIPIELAVGEEARKIELPSVQKLYVTTYKEVSGLERTLVVFVPSEIPSQPDNQQHSLDLHDLQLSQCIQRYTDKDRTALWHVASRSLSSLVLILP